MNGWETNALAWAALTETGDLSENVASGAPGFQGLRAKLTTVGEECLGRKCRQIKRCFLRRARAKALAADVIVANHSLVFAEMNMRSPALPDYGRIIFDEAHNLENAATSHLSVEISRSRILCS